MTVAFITYSFADTNWQIDSTQIGDAKDLAKLSELVQKGDKTSENEFVELLKKYPQAGLTKHVNPYWPPAPTGAAVDVFGIMSEVSHACLKSSQEMRAMFLQMFRDAQEQIKLEAQNKKTMDIAAADAEKVAGILNAVATIASALGEAGGSGAGLGTLTKSENADKLASKATKEVATAGRIAKAVADVKAKATEKLDTVLKKLDEAKAETKKAREQVTEMRKKVVDPNTGETLDKVDNKLADAKKNIKTKEQEKADVQKQLDDVDAELTSLAKHTDPHAPGHTERTVRTLELKNKIKPELEKKLKAADDELNVATVERDQLQVRSDQLRAGTDPKVADKLIENSKLANRLDAQKAASERRLAEGKEKKTENDAQIADADSQLDNLRGQLDTINAQRAGSSKKLDDVDGQLAKLGKKEDLESQMAAYDKDDAELESKYAEVKDLKAKVADTPSLKPDLDRATYELDELAKKGKSQAMKREEVNQDLKSVNALTKDRENLLKEIGEANFASSQVQKQQDAVWEKKFALQKTGDELDTGIRTEEANQKTLDKQLGQATTGRLKQLQGQDELEVAENKLKKAETLEATAQSEYDGAKKDADDLERADTSVQKHYEDASDTAKTKDAEAKMLVQLAGIRNALGQSFGHFLQGVLQASATPATYEQRMDQAEAEFIEAMMRILETNASALHDYYRDHKEAEDSTMQWSKDVFNAMGGASVYRNFS